MLVFGILLLAFKHMPAGLLCPPDSFTDILQFVFALVFSQNTKAQCSADHYGFSSYTHAVVSMHPLSNLPIGILWYICIDEIFLEEMSFGVGREVWVVNTHSWKQLQGTRRDLPFLMKKNEFQCWLSTLLIHCQAQFGLNKAAHTHMLEILWRA